MKFNWAVKRVSIGLFKIDVGDVVENINLIVNCDQRSKDDLILIVEVALSFG